MILVRTNYPYLRMGCHGLGGNNIDGWYNLVAWVANTRLNEEKDKFMWGLHQNGIFYVNSMHMALISDDRERLDSQFADSGYH
jgi:hypothetical protein